MPCWPSRGSADAIGLAGKFRRLPRGAAGNRACAARGGGRRGIRGARCVREEFAEERDRGRWNDFFSREGMKFLDERGATTVTTGPSSFTSLMIGLLGADGSSVGD